MIIAHEATLPHRRPVYTVDGNLIRLVGPRDPFPGAPAARLHDRAKNTTLRERRATRRFIRRLREAA